MTDEEMKSYWRIRFSMTGGASVAFIRCGQRYIDMFEGPRHQFLDADGVTLADALRWAAAKLPLQGACKHCGGKP